MLTTIRKSIFVTLLVIIAMSNGSIVREKRQAYGDGSYRPQQPAYQQQGQYYPPPKAQKVAGPQTNEEEENKGPHPLTKLLENSKFDCGSKKDGYYADSGVGCQAFHYCISGQKHSMMCPAGTVFHQVHLNCVPADQDICAKADKFFFVNDYLHKPLDQRGPNNTVQYQQRYYPEGYANGDPFIPPQDAKGGQASQQGYAPQPQAYKPNPQPVYNQVQEYKPRPQTYVPPPTYQQPQQAYVKPQPLAPFTPQQAYAVPQNYQAQQTYRQPNLEAYDRPIQSPDQASLEQAQALKAHKAAEAAVIAQQYKFQNEQALQNQQQTQYQTNQYQQGQYQAGQFNNGQYDDGQYKPQLYEYGQY